MQESTRESRFFLLYGRDPRLPSELLNSPVDRHEMDQNTYKGEVAASLSDAWELARANIEKAQKHQKMTHDRRAGTPKYHVGDKSICLHAVGKSY